jgi:hypothetical protein
MEHAPPSWATGSIVPMWLVRIHQQNTSYRHSGVRPLAETRLILLSSEVHGHGRTRYHWPLTTLCGGDDVNHCPVGNPERKVWWAQQQVFPSVMKPRFIESSRKNTNSRRRCPLASRQLWTIYRVPCPVLCFASSNAEPAHNTTKYFAPNLRWGCQSHRFAVNKGMSVSGGKQ